MQVKRVPRYIKKMRALGARRTAAVIRNRVTAALSDRVWRYRARQGTLGVTWKDVQRATGSELMFEQFLSSIRRQPSEIIRSVYHESGFDPSADQADAFVEKTFDILGSGTITYKDIPWHRDIRLARTSPHADTDFSADVFYKDVKYTIGSEQLTKDIKVPWELSRFQYVPYLGYTYHQTQDTKYADAFVEQVSDWLDNNTLLMGPNWVCPMDVGLRAVSWVHGFLWFKDVPSITGDFWQRFVCSLFDHLVYLENNWEVYDSRTSNHYLSDLVGYAYLCWFFVSLPTIGHKAQWCTREILSECEKQVFSEGADYEGSTGYHRLVTELFYHGFLVAQQQGHVIPEWFTTRLNAMFSFIAWNTDSGGNYMYIGDHDSGKALLGVTDALVTNMIAQRPQGEVTFSQFGLSIVKQDRWHITLRHHAYQLHQPSGHFHNDANSVTVSLDGVPLFIDPASYVYTPSAQWRNAFRSVANHNTFFIEGHEPVSFGDYLFALDVPVHSLARDDALHAYHNLYVRYGLRAHRQLDLSSGALVIRDTWHAIGTVPQDMPLCVWNFTVHPTISVHQAVDGVVLSLDGRDAALLSSDQLKFTVVKGWASFEYGAKEPTTQLRAQREVDIDRVITMKVHPL